MLRLLRPLLLAWMVIAASCVMIIQRGSIEEILPGSVATPRRVESPMKAFMSDGSTVVFARGGSITSDSVQGIGTRYTLALADTIPTEAIPLDSVVGIEAFQGRVDGLASFAATVGLSAVAVIGGAALAVAIFGSCPTFYASAEQGADLLAEAFSYSIAPLLEARDLDALRIGPDADGRIRLELRNEALETLYINQIQLLAVDHLAGARAIPDDRGVPIGVAAEAPLVAALDRDGGDALDALVTVDDRAYSSSLDRIQAATSADDRDHVELVFDRPPGESAVVVLRLRNSLLTTVLFYDMMLGRAGAGAVDWIGRDMARIGSVVELGRWFQTAMGLRVQILEGDEWVTVGRVPDTGPIAWEEVGVRVPLPPSGPVRVRLSFFTDAWRIDRVTLARPAELNHVARLAPTAFEELGQPTDDSDILQLIAEPDEGYLVTYPGTAATLEFEPPARIDGLERSFLLASQGYYTEWVRSEWIRNADRAMTFEPGDDTVETLMRLWTAKKDAFEADFFASRIPVR
jgi:hypothetical protein